MDPIKPNDNCKGCFRDCPFTNLTLRMRQRTCIHYPFLPRFDADESRNEIMGNITRILDRLNPEHRDHQIPLSEYMAFLIDLDKTTLEQEMQYWQDREVYERCEYIRIILNIKFPNQ